MRHFKLWRILPRHSIYLYFLCGAVIANRGGGRGEREEESNSGRVPFSTSFPRGRTQQKTFLHFPPLPRAFIVEVHKKREKEKEASSSFSVSSFCLLPSRRGERKADFLRWPKEEGEGEEEAISCGGCCKGGYGGNESWQRR